MDHNLRVAKDFCAMRDLGIPEEKTKPVLKSLVKFYEKNWALIEEENYRALADAIFDSEEAEAAEQKTKPDNAEAAEKKKNIEQAERMKAIEEETQIQEEPERPLQQLCLRHQDGQASPFCINPSTSSSGTLLKWPKLEVDELTEAQPQLQSWAKTAITEPVTGNDSLPVSPLKRGRNNGKQTILPNALARLEGSDVSQSGDVESTHLVVADATDSDSAILSRRLRDKGKEPLLPHSASREKRSISDNPSPVVCFKEPKVEPVIDVMPKQKTAIIQPKDEPLTVDPPWFEVPLPVIRPGYLTVSENREMRPATQQSCANGTPSTLLTPLLLPIPTLPSTPHTTTDNNDDTTFYRSIRCKRSHAIDVSADVPESSATNKKTRGPVRGEKVLQQVIANGRIRVEYEDDMKASNKEVHDGLVRIVGAYIRDKVPMNVPTYAKLPKEVKTNLYNHLSTKYDIVKEDPRMDTYIETMARDRFKEWKYEIRNDWKEHGDDVPLEFKDRKTEWEWLVNHFKEEESKKKSDQMTKIRRSDNKKNHTSGPTRFGHRAKTKKKEGCLAPHVAVFVEVYRRNDSEAVERVEANMEQAVASFIVSQPPLDEGFEGATQPVTLPLEAEISLIQGERPQKRGTTVSGFGASVQRPPKARGGSRSTRAEMEELAKRLKESEENRLKDLENHRILIEQLKAERKELEEKLKADIFAQVTRMMAERDPAAGSSGASLG